MNWLQVRQFGPYFSSFSTNSYGYYSQKSQNLFSNGQTFASAQIVLQAARIAAQFDHSPERGLMILEQVEIIQGDITRLEVEAIVNAANEKLLGGGGVDGAIHRAAGPELLKACRELDGCPTGEAKITKGYNLPARYVIHTVGPVWQGGGSNENNLLASCYRNSLQLAVDHNLRSIAFPSISTGVYRFPIKLASRIALRVIFDFVETEEAAPRVVMTCFSGQDLDIYRQIYQDLLA